MFKCWMRGAIAGACLDGCVRALQNHDGMGAFILFSGACFMFMINYE